MYLATKTVQGIAHYSIRESYVDEKTGTLTSREIIEIGPSPGSFWKYPGGNACYLDPELCDRMEELSPDSCAEELERLFLPFLDRNIRTTLNDFSRRKTPRKKPLTRDQEEAIHRLHIFDKRRQLYLRTGSPDLRDIYRIKPVFFRDLLEKSRDELEQFFLAMETVLNSDERKLYAYAIFDIQRFFSGPFARTIPLTLDQERVDDFFEMEFCALTKDEKFWQGFARQERIPGYLVRYLVMYFDNTYRQGMMDEENIRSFMNSRREHRPPPPPSSVSPEETAGLFAMPGEQLQKMTHRELTRRYRKMAHEHHPDKGGDKEKFVRLTEAYRRLLHGKKRK